MKKLLVQLQLSNYDTHGKWILECDSGYQMCLGRIREMLKHNAELQIFVMGPKLSQCRTLPFEINNDLFRAYGDRLHYVPIDLIPNALATRYDFDFEGIAKALSLGTDKDHKFTHVYINDPMLLRNYKALFLLKTKYKPFFAVHSHFVDVPSCPKFPEEASLWLGQCEAAIKADFNFWQCDSAMRQFFDEMAGTYKVPVIKDVYDKSCAWDDGYSSAEMHQPVNYKNVRFDVEKLKLDLRGRTLVFVPNRVGGKGRSSDYTNCGKFLFDVVPEIWRKRQDFTIIAGNPSQKFSNDELVELCPAVMKIVPDALNRDEYKVIADLHDISVGLYNQDAYGGTSARELLDIGSIPFWVDNYEYQTIAQEAGWDRDLMVHPDLEDLGVKFEDTLEWFNERKLSGSLFTWRQRFREVIKRKCSYESTTQHAMELMGLL